ncbi:MAG TPA: hypothetical protein VFT29_19095 [Gemmatimonadaceae bacterium]|nr:hypothetical protein [Gemmatimonadaceae bacterium]
MVRESVHGVPKTIWTYAYEIVPPQPEIRMAAITTLLDREHQDAQREERTWVGRIVLGQHITHILVVSDSPDQLRPVNARLEAEFKALKLVVSLTAPMAVVDDRKPAPPAPKD